MATPAPGEIRVSPAGDEIAWHRPEDDDDHCPWAILSVPMDEGITPDWTHASDDEVTDWRVVGATGGAT